jgi:two-component system sensor histidine kinase BaeS
MKLPLPRSLRWRLFAGLAATVAISIGVTLVAGAFLTRRSLEREGIRSLVRQVDLIATQRSAKGIGRRDAPDLGDFLSTEQEQLTILTPQQADLLLPDAAARALRSHRVASGTLSLRGTRYLYAARRNGPEALVLLRSAREQSADWQPFLIGLALAGGVGAVLAALVAFAFARAIARPITRVAGASRRLAAGAAHQPLAEEGAGEVADLAVSFNHLAAELELAQEAERAFLLSVSHELKTPLTAIRGHAEALEDGVLGAREAGEVIRREARRLERLIRDLLDLARLRRRTFSVGDDGVDLDAVARECVERFQTQARRYQVALTAAGEPGAAAAGDADRVLQAVSNLVENAIRCTPAGGAVRVLATASRIEVVDDGPGLSESDLERAFERFYLYERYGAERAVGTGLGLAIVRELAEAMGGSVEVRSAIGVGSTFSLVLPPAHDRRRPAATQVAGTHA